MKHNVNLYLPSLQPKLRVLSLPFVVVIWCLVILFTVLVDSYLSFEHKELSAELAQIETRERQQNVLLTTLKKEVDGLVEDPKLMDQVARKQQIVKVKKRVYAELVGQETQKSTGFADLMIDLAKNHQKELWLTHIYLDDQQVIIEGETEDSAAIPKWVNNLGQSSYFSQQEFAETRIFRNDNQQLAFVLTSAAAVKEVASNE